MEEQKKGKVLMNSLCYYCKGRLIEQITSVDFWWGDDLKIIEGVPARVCQQCGEKYFEADVYKVLERLAKGSGRAERRLSVDVMRYSPA
ncbi:MAG: YgiT-type zinc finger protein [Nitrospiraceae bacterium]